MPKYVPRKVARSYFENVRAPSEEFAITKIERSYGIWTATFEGPGSAGYWCALDHHIAEWAEKGEREHGLA